MKKIALALCAVLSLGVPATANAQDAYLGEIRWFPYNFCPRDWTYANGQTMQVSKYNALFSLLGNTYGGDGVTTFGLPDLRGRVSIAPASGSGLVNHVLGEKGGYDYVTSNYLQLPPYVVTASPSTPVAVSKAPAGADASTTVNVPPSYSVTGSSQPQDNHPPYLVMQACINISGIYPSRD